MFLFQLSDFSSCKGSQLYYTYLEGVSDEGRLFADNAAFFGSGLALPDEFDYFS